MKNLKFLFILLLIFTVACGNKETTSSIETSDELIDGEKATITGRVLSYQEGNLFFTLVDGLDPFEDNYTIFIDGDEPITLNDYVRVSGIWLDEVDALETHSLEVLTEKEKSEYLQQRFAYLEIEIKDYPNNISHTCETPKFTLQLTNKGSEEITHQDLYDDDYPYAIFYFINNNHSRANAALDNYETVFVSPGNANMNYISNQGITHFNNLKSNQNAEAEYWGGGLITKSEFGTGGSPNIFGNYNQGKNKISFAWAIKNNFDPIFLFESEPVEINLVTEECILR